MTIRNRFRELTDTAGKTVAEKLTSADLPERQYCMWKYDIEYDFRDATKESYCRHHGKMRKGDRARDSALERGVMQER